MSVHLLYVPLRRQALCWHWNYRYERWSSSPQGIYGVLGDQYGRVLQSSCIEEKLFWKFPKQELSSLWFLSYTASQLQCCHKGGLGLFCPPDSTPDSNPWSKYHFNSPKNPCTFTVMSNPLSSKSVLSRTINLINREPGLSCLHHFYASGRDSFLFLLCPVYFWKYENSKYNKTI